MIEPYRGYLLYCDICDHEEGPFEWLDEADDYREKHGWETKDGKDICPECREKPKEGAE